MVYKKLVLVMFLAVMLFVAVPAETGDHSFEVDRIAGDNRIESVIEISREGWDDADNVVIAREDDYADALAGVPLAYSIDAPILLTASDELYPEVKEEIQRLDPEFIIILGGPIAISYDVGEELEDLSDKIFRFDGIDRFATARAIAEELYIEEGADESVVAYGYDFPDALAVGPYAAVNDYPILLTRTSRLNSRTEGAQNDLDVRGSYVVGGTAVIEDSVYNNLPDPHRLHGANRYETAVAINEHFADGDTDHIYIVTGRDFAEAISGSVLAAKNGTGILLVSDRNMGEALNYIQDNGIERVTILGNVNAVSEDVEAYLRDAGGAEEEEEPDFDNGYDEDAEYEVPEDTDLDVTVWDDDTGLRELKIRIEFEPKEKYESNKIDTDAMQPHYDDVESILLSKFHPDVGDEAMKIIKQKDDIGIEIEEQIQLDGMQINIYSGFMNTWADITVWPR